MGNKRTSRRIASSKAMSLKPTPARDQVLQTYELVHHIFIHADISALLSCHQVCKSWYEIISRSRVLQENLYFQPCHLDDKTTSKQIHAVNPLLVKHFQPLSTFGDNLSSHTYHYPPSLGHRQLMVPSMSITKMKNGRKVHEAFTRSGATWRKMLVSQPPITSVGYMHRTNWDGERSILSFPNGLRMGELYDMIFETIWMNADKANTRARVAPPFGDYYDFGNPSFEQMTAKAGCQPGLLILSEHRLYATRACRGRQCTCSDYKWRQDGRCRVLRDEYLRKRGRKASRWMFECEDFEEGKFSYENLKRIAGL